MEQRLPCSRLRVTFEHLATLGSLLSLMLRHFSKEQLQATMPRWLEGGRCEKQASESTEEDTEITTVLGSVRGRVGAVVGSEAVLAWTGVWHSY